MEEVIMSEKEWDRYKTLQQVVDGKLTQKAAACLLGITDRQVRNLLQQVVLQGTRGVISKRRGKPSNRKKSQSFKEKALSVLRGKLEGFGPTLAQEKLLEMAQLAVSRETLRQWMIQEHLWMPRTSKKRIHLPVIRHHIAE